MVSYSLNMAGLFLPVSRGELSDPSSWKVAAGYLAGGDDLVLAAITERFFRDEQFLERCGAVGVDVARRTFDSRATGKVYKRILDGVLAGNSNDGGPSACREPQGRGEA